MSRHQSPVGFQSKEVALSSPWIRTEGDGQSASSMTSILTEWKTTSAHSLVSIRDEDENEERQPVEPATLDPTTAQRQQLEEHSNTGSAFSVSEGADTVALLQSDDQAFALPGRKAGPSHSVSVPADTGRSAAPPQNLLRKQGASDSFLPDRARSLRRNQSSSSRKKSILDIVRRGSKLKTRESLMSIEHQRRLTSHGALFVSPDVQSIERLTAKQGKASATGSKLLATCFLVDDGTVKSISQV